MTRYHQDHGYSIHLDRFLLLVIASISLISIARASCIDTCNCIITNLPALNDSSRYSFPDYEYTCGKTQSEVLFAVYSNRGIRITCKGLNNLAYLNALKHIKTTSNLSWFDLENCSLPNISFVEIFKILKLHSVRHLDVELVPNTANEFKPFHFEKTGSLDTLYLMQNNITELPDSIFKDTFNLTRLNLRMNRLHNLPANIFNSMSQLDHLNLGRNYLTKLDSDIFRNTPLLTLNLDQNRLIEISRTLFASLSFLDKLNLTKNDLRRIEDGAFDGLTRLRILDLVAAFNAEVNSPPSGLFINLKLLESVNMDSNNFTTLPKGLFNRCGWLNLKVSLRNNFIQRLPSGVFIKTNISELDLSDNYLEYLDEGVFLNMPTLHDLRLSRNRLKKIHSNSLANLKSLFYLYMNENELVDFEVGTFADLHALDTLDLSRNKLTLESWMTVSPFNHCTEMQILDLAHNLITKIFDDWRNNLTSLHKLDLSFNKLDNLTALDFMFAKNGLSVYFASNPIKNINLSELEALVKSRCPLENSWDKVYLDYRNPVDFHMENTSSLIECDCDTLYLARYLQGKMWWVVKKYVDIIPTDITCNWPGSLKKISLYKVDLIMMELELCYEARGQY